MSYITLYNKIGSRAPFDANIIRLDHSFGSIITIVLVVKAINGHTTSYVPTFERLYNNLPTFQIQNVKLRTKGRLVFHISLFRAVLDCTQDCWRGNLLVFQNFLTLKTEYVQDRP